MKIEARLNEVFNYLGSKMRVRTAEPSASVDSHCVRSERKYKWIERFSRTAQICLSLFCSILVVVWPWVGIGWRGS